MKVKPKSGAWECGCEDTLGEVVKEDVIDGEQMAFVCTPCGNAWMPVDSLKEADPEIQAYIESFCGYSSLDEEERDALYAIAKRIWNDAVDRCIEEVVKAYEGAK